MLGSTVESILYDEGSMFVIPGLILIISNIILFYYYYNLRSILEEELLELFDMFYSLLLSSFVVFTVNKIPKATCFIMKY